MNREGPAGDFERWLDRELPVAIATGMRSAEPPPSPSAFAARPSRRGVARLGTRGAAVLGAIALAVAGGGAALATGSPNPVSWGQSVVQAAASVAPAQHTPQAPSVAPRTPASAAQTPAAAGTASPDLKPGQAKHQEATPPAGSGHAAKTHDPPGKAKGQKPDQ